MDKSKTLGLYILLDLLGRSLSPKESSRTEIKQRLNRLRKKLKELLNYPIGEK